MGRKKMARKRTSPKPSSPPKVEQPGNPPPVEVPTAVQQQQPPPPVTQPGATISLDSLANILRQSNPTVNWAATLTILTQVGGLASQENAVPATSVPPQPVPSTEIPPTTTPTPEIPPPESSKPSPAHPQNEPLDVSPLSAYQGPGTNEEGTKEGIPEGMERVEEKEIDEEKEKEEKGNEGKRSEAERTPTRVTTPGTERFEGVDLNKTARKQGLMTDEEFQSILDRGARREEHVAGMAEGLDLASEAVGEVSKQETQEEPPEIPKVQTTARISTVAKPKGVKRKLVMKSDQKVKRQKPSRVSQRCLGQGMTRRTGAITASKAVEIQAGMRK